VVAAGMQTSSMAVGGHPAEAPCKSDRITRLPSTRELGAKNRVDGIDIAYMR